MGISPCADFCSEESGALPRFLRYSYCSASLPCGETCVTTEVLYTSCADAPTIKIDETERMVMIVSIVAIIFLVILFFIVVSPFPISIQPMCFL